jgi:hypothetical protein
MITDLAKKLKNSKVPLFKTIHEQDGTSITAVGLKRGLRLNEKDANSPSRLLVIKGEIDFNTPTESRRYACYESYDIPHNTNYSFEAWDDAIFLLFNQNETS